MANNGPLSDLECREEALGAVRDALAGLQRVPAAALDDLRQQRRRRARTDGGQSASDTDRKETVTITMLTNHEVDPDEFDLRVRKPEKIREQLMSAADRTGFIQQVAANGEQSLREYREEIKEARDDE